MVTSYVVELDSVIVEIVQDRQTLLVTNSVIRLRSPVPRKCIFESRVRQKIYELIMRSLIK